MLIQKLRQSGYLIPEPEPRRPSFFDRLWRGVKEAWAFIVMTDGQGMVEYALLLMLIGGVVLVILIVLGNQVHNVFNNISCAVGKLGSCAPHDN